MRARIGIVLLASIGALAACGVDPGDGVPNAAPPPETSPTADPDAAPGPDEPPSPPRPGTADEATRDELIDVIQAAVALMVPGVTETCLAEAALDAIGEDRVRAYVTAPDFQPYRDDLPLTADEQAVARRAITLEFAACDEVRSAFRDDFVVGAGGASLGADGVDCAVDQLGEVVAGGVVDTLIGESFDGFALGRAEAPRLFGSCPEFGADVIATQLASDGIALDREARACIEQELEAAPAADEIDARDIEAIVATCV